MKKKMVQYSDEKLGAVKVITDFLPKPEELIVKEDTIKVTLSLTKQTVEFFKLQAKKHHTQYQKMIRALLSQYAAHYQR